jgi:hypothetical protein
MVEWVVFVLCVEELMCSKLEISAQRPPVLSEVFAVFLHPSIHMHG